MGVKWTDIVMAISAVAIPIVLAIQSSSIELKLAEIEVETRTLEHLRVFDISTRKLREEKQRIDNRNGVAGPMTVSAEYLNSDPILASKVVAILNEYEIFCYGVNTGLLSQEVFDDLLGTAVPEVYKVYGEFVAYKRSVVSRKKELWAECEKWIASNQ